MIQSLVGGKRALKCLKAPSVAPQTLPKSSRRSNTEDEDEDDVTGTVVPVGMYRGMWAYIILDIMQTCAREEWFSYLGITTTIQQ